jgi:cell division FtsZ-interacting protein ZapD
MRGHMRCDFCVQRVLSVQALGNRLDHQVAFGQARQIVVVIGRLDQRSIIGYTPRSWA